MLADIMQAYHPRSGMPAWSRPFCKQINYKSKATPFLSEENNRHSRTEMITTVGTILEQIRLAAGPGAY
jgi:hypothetical protein